MPAWAVATVGVLIATGWTAALIWVAYPRYSICPAIYPAPPGCSDRMAVAVPWVAAEWLALAVALVILRLRSGRPLWAVTALALVLLVGAAGYRAVLFGVAPFVS